MQYTANVIRINSCLLGNYHIIESEPSKNESEVGFCIKNKITCINVT